MHDALTLFKRNINELFGICVDILNVGRSLQQLSWSMQILANNGVVQAAKVGGGKGRPMLALVEILNHTPKEIRPEVASLERLCATLAKVTASSSNIAWRYHQLLASLLSTIAHSEQASTPATHDLLARLRFTTAEDVAQLMRHPRFAAEERLQRDNHTFIADLCQTNLVQLHERLKDAVRCLGETRQALGGLKMIGLTSRYMAFCIASEAAGLAEAEANFRNLSAEITRVVDDLDAKTRAMKDAIDHGQELLELLLKGQTYAK
ncbi:hypothetical protein FBQ96_00695 [Nitrospirales bacterium NOB]|nr:MAG: hypothetical protein UZ03_NOB001002572 [Nitrospira sp. OLB3]MBV6470138.1 hypothetical protein [Nitrospirota bacterium]MCE7965032.1 hypothetical protein [Nitrospira sp. NTP2]MCK6498057.1 hypothetical protein [Nitrospira sp.]MDL1888099.1 hypothetical protein [Nitrospirales bacterium NOB]MEB2337899.1 hypothetical protein [Nitrospirales bacterium]